MTGRKPLFGVPPYGCRPKRSVRRIALRASALPMPPFLVCITGFVPSHRRVRGERSEGPGLVPSGYGCTGVMIRVRTATSAVHTLRLTCSIVAGPASERT